MESSLRKDKPNVFKTRGSISKEKLGKQKGKINLIADRFDPILDKLKTDKYLRTLFRMKENLFIKKSEQSEENSTENKNGDSDPHNRKPKQKIQIASPRGFQGVITHSPRSLKNRDTNGFNSKILPPISSPRSPQSVIPRRIDNKRKESIQMTRDENTYFLPFYDCLSEDQSIRENIAASMEKEVMDTVTKKIMFNNGIGGTRNIRRLSIKLKEEEKKELDSQVSPSKKNRSLFQNKPIVKSTKFQTVKLDLDNIYSGLLNQVNTFSMGQIPKKEEPPQAKSEKGHLSFPKEFIDSQLKHSMNDLMRYKKELKSHLNHLHTDLTDKIKQSSIMNKCLDMYTVKVPKTNKFLMDQQASNFEQLKDEEEKEAAETRPISPTVRVSDLDPFKCIYSKFEILLFYPPSRMNPILVKMKDNNSKFLYCGGVGSDVLSDSYILDLETKKWSPTVR